MVLQKALVLKGHRPTNLLERLRPLNSQKWFKPPLYTSCIGEKLCCTMVEDWSRTTANLWSRSMLQDPSIQHLISWSSSNESFVMSPSSDFSKVLAYVVLYTGVTLKNTTDAASFHAGNISNTPTYPHLYGNLTCTDSTKVLHNARRNSGDCCS